jgi:cyclopropane-fatty-acyl-phospholipid synthase
MGFERGWTSLFQILASRPLDMTERRDHATARLGVEQRDYPFNRAYMYRQSSNAEPTDSARAIS